MLQHRACGVPVCSGQGESQCTRVRIERDRCLVRLPGAASEAYCLPFAVVLNARAFTRVTCSSSTFLKKSPKNHSVKICVKTDIYCLIIKFDILVQNLSGFHVDFILILVSVRSAEFHFVLFHAVVKIDPAFGNRHIGFRQSGIF